MRLSQWGRSEIIDLADGSRLGLVGDSDLAIDPATGVIQGLVLPARRGLFPGPGRLIPRPAFRRLAADVVIVDLSAAR